MEYTELRKKGVYLGRAGEDGKKTVWLDVTAWNTAYDAGAGVLLFTSPAGRVWPMGAKTVTDDVTGAVTMEAPVTAAETALAGVGHIEAQWISGGEKVKSQTFNAMVLESGYTGENVPDNAPGWVADLITELNAAGTLLEELGEVASEAHGAYEEIRGTSALIDQALNTAEQTVAQAAASADEAEAARDLANAYKTAAAASATAAATSAESAMSDTPTGYSSLVASVAGAYSSSKGYAVGDYVLKDSTLYRCIVAIDDDGETWDATHWAAVTVGWQFSQIAGDLSKLDNYCPHIGPGNFVLGKALNASTGAASDNDRVASMLVPVSVENVKYIEWTGAVNEEHSYHAFAYFYTGADEYINRSTLFDQDAGRKIDVPSGAKTLRLCFAYYSADEVTTITPELINPYIGVKFTTNYDIEEMGLAGVVSNLGNYAPYVCSDDFTMGKSVNSTTGVIGDNQRAASTLQPFRVGNAKFIEWTGEANTDHGYHVFIYFYSDDEGTEYIGQRTLYDSGVPRNVTVPDNAKSAKLCFVYYYSDGVTTITPALIDPYFGISVKTDYEDSVIKSIAESVNANIDGNNIIFVHVTDSHVGTSEMPNYRAAAHLNKLMTLAKAVNADFVMHTGDMIEGSLTAEEGSELQDRQNYMAYSSDIGKYHIPFGWCQGNPWHDFGHRIHEGQNTEYTLNRDIVINYMGRFGKWHEMHFNESDTVRSYYYFDLPLQKTRVIVIDADDRTTDDIIRMNIGFSPTQIQWFSDTLTDAKANGLAVIVFSHIALQDQFNYSNSTIEGRGGTQLVNAMKSFIASGGTLCECVAGHTHADKVATVDGINYVVSACDVPKNYAANVVPAGMTAPQRTVDTLSEYCFTVHVVNPFTRSVKLYRYGAGNTSLVFPTEQF